MPAVAGLTLELVQAAHAARLRIAAGTDRPGDDQLITNLCRLSTLYVYERAGRGLSDQDEEDVLQDFAARLYKALPGLHGGLENVRIFKGWLNTIANNARKDKLSEMISNREHIVLSPNDGGSFDKPDVRINLQIESIDDAHVGTQLRRCIARLPRVYRPVVELRLVRRFSAKETAHLLGVPEKTVETRLHRARERLSQMPDIIASGAEYNIGPGTRRRPPPAAAAPQARQQKGGLG
jgi:RNA polymerase sigma factor (sigma-70 family)